MRDESFDNHWEGEPMDSCPGDETPSGKGGKHQGGPNRWSADRAPKPPWLVVYSYLPRTWCLSAATITAAALRIPLRSLSASDDVYRPTGPRLAHCLLVGGRAAGPRQLRLNSLAFLQDICTVPGE